MDDYPDAVYGATYNTTVYGDTRGEAELAALDEARAFFGPEPELRISPDPMFRRTNDLDRRAYGADKTYRASIAVREVLDAG